MWRRCGRRSQTTTCAILLEPVLGEGGVHVLSTEFLQEARKLADAIGALLIFDEIQSGLGRTGRWFAFEPQRGAPDVLILGKPLGGGLPLSALLVTEKLFHSLRHGEARQHAGRNAAGLPAGVEFLDVMEQEKVLAQNACCGSAVAERLERLAQEYEEVVEVRGDGLMWGVEMTVPARPIAEEGLRAWSDVQRGAGQCAALSAAADPLGGAGG